MTQQRDDFGKRMKQHARDVREGKVKPARKRKPAKAGNRMPRSLSAARARDVDRLVLEIAEAMCAGSWSSGVLASELLEREKVTASAVEQWAAQAGRLLRIAPKIDERARLNLARLDRAHALATDTKEAVAAVAEQNKMLGLHAPVRVKIEASVEAMQKLSTREQLTKARELFAALPEVIAKLEAKLAEEEAITVPVLPESTS